MQETSFVCVLQGFRTTGADPAHGLNEVGTSEDLAWRAYFRHGNGQDRLQSVQAVNQVLAGPLVAVLKSTLMVALDPAALDKFQSLRRVRGLTKIRRTDMLIASIVS